MSEKKLLTPQGGYKHLKSFQIAQLVYDVTVRFCDRYISIKSRTHDQMVQAARSGVQNIAEGSSCSATSKKFEIKLTNVARASLEELRLDYQDFLRQRGYEEWTRENPLRQSLIDQRCSTVDQVAKWIYQVKMSTESTTSTFPTFASISANTALVLIAVSCSLLDRQLTFLENQFLKEGGFTERLYKVRKASKSSF